MIDAFDFFAGCTGWGAGAEATGGVRLVGAANHAEIAVQCIEANHPHLRGRVVTQDLRQLDYGRLPRFDLALTSPVCTADSQCGQPARSGTGGNYSPDVAAMAIKRAADRDTAWAVVSMLETCRPRRFTLENVPDMERWVLFSVFLDAIRRLGYHTDRAVVNASHFGGAQDRNRLVMLGGLDRAPEVDRGDPSRAGCIGDTLDAHDAPANRWHPIASKSERMRVRIHKAHQTGGDLYLWNNVSESSGRPMEALWPTLTTKSASQLCLVDYPNQRIRVVNTREIARAQGFGDDHWFPKQKAEAGILIGNAIHRDVAEAQVRRAIA